MASIEEVNSLPMSRTGKLQGGTPTMNVCSSRSQTVCHSVKCFWYDRTIRRALFKIRSCSWRFLSVSVNNSGGQQEKPLCKYGRKGQQSKPTCMPNVHTLPEMPHTFNQNEADRLHKTWLHLLSLHSATTNSPIMCPVKVTYKCSVTIQTSAPPPNPQNTLSHTFSLHPPASNAFLTSQSKFPKFIEKCFIPRGSSPIG